MKKLLLSVVICLSAFSFCQAQVQFGGGLQYLKPSGGSSIGIGATAIIPLNENFDIKPSFHYFFEEFTLYAIDADVQYTGLVLNESVRLNPFAGLNLFGGDLDSTLGINLGLSVIAPINETLDLYVEPKLILISDLDGFAISAGVLF